MSANVFKEYETYTKYITKVTLKHAKLTYPIHKPSKYFDATDSCYVMTNCVNLLNQRAIVICVTSVRRSVLCSKGNLHSRYFSYSYYKAYLLSRLLMRGLVSQNETVDLQTNLYSQNYKTRRHTVLRSLTVKTIQYETLLSLLLAAVTSSTLYLSPPLSP